MATTAQDWITHVRQLFNADKVQTSNDVTLDTHIVRSFNFAIRDLAKAEYWKVFKDLNIVASTSTYNLLTGMEAGYEFVKIYEIRYGTNYQHLKRLSDYEDFIRAKAEFTSEATPQWWFILSNILHLVPTPSESATGGAHLYYSYRPADLVDGTSTPPAVPASYDDVFVYKALRDLYLRDRTAKGAMQLFQIYDGLYESAKAELLAQSYGPVIGRPGR